MIQLAWLWLRYQPGSELAEWFRKRVGTLAGRTRRIAIVAVARKLLIAFWRYVETGVVPFKRCPPTLPISQRVAVGHKWTYLPEAIRDPSVHGILPTTDAIIVLIQLAKDPGADRSVNEISVLPQHFKMDDLLIGLSFPESRAREASC